MNICDICGYEVPEDELLGVRLQKHSDHHYKYMGIYPIYYSSRELYEKHKEKKWLNQK